MYLYVDKYICIFLCLSPEGESVCHRESRGSRDLNTIDSTEFLRIYLPLQAREHDLVEGVTDHAPRE